MTNKNARRARADRSDHQGRCAGTVNEGEGRTTCKGGPSRSPRPARSLPVRSRGWVGARAGGDARRAFPARSRARAACLTLGPQGRGGIRAGASSSSATRPCSSAARRRSCTTRRNDGVVDIVWTLPGYTPGRFPTVEVFELPFMMANAEATSQRVRSSTRSISGSEFKDVHVIAVHVHGPGCSTSRQADPDARGPAGHEDPRRRRGSINELLGTLGATPVGMPVPADPRGALQGRDRRRGDPLGGRRRRSRCTSSPRITPSSPATTRSTPRRSCSA